MTRVSEGIRRGDAMTRGETHRLCRPELWRPGHGHGGDRGVLPGSDR
jgi:hypothetical protein